MAAGKKAPLIRSTYYFGSKSVQVGALKGGVKPGFISMQPKTASEIGIKLVLPTDIPETKYKITNGVIYGTSTNSKGQVVDRPIRSKVGSKKVTIIAKGARPGAKGSKLKGSKGRNAPSPNRTIVLGVPTWAGIEEMHTFLKGSKAISFRINGVQRNIRKAATSGK